MVREFLLLLQYFLELIIEVLKLRMRSLEKWFYKLRKKIKKG
jgi:hypothetical protein